MSGDQESIFDKIEPDFNLGISFGSPSDSDIPWWEDPRYVTSEKPDYTAHAKANNIPLFTIDPEKMKYSDSNDV